MRAKRSLLRSVAALVALVLVGAVSCGGGDAREEPDAARSTAPAATADADRCEAFRELAAAQPPAGSLGPEEWKAAYDRYADAAGRAAAVSASDDAAVLRELAAVMRVVADDPADPELADRVRALGDPVHELAVEVEAACGVTFGLGSG